ncbi:MAG: hypothetical protein GY841_01435 [FCB group bacterium]|nr:hypothetical protein [FCB group bacterium]
MSGKSIITVVLLLFVATSLAYFISQEAGTTENTTNDKAAAVETVNPEAVVVYYFHNIRRCPTCTKIEELAYKVVHERFAEALASGDLIWKVVNVEEDENKHFADEYQLIVQALVLVDYRPETDGQWKNLEKIWDLVGDEKQFFDYVDDGIKTFMGEG